jgi:hypothetical protein
MVSPLRLMRGDRFISLRAQNAPVEMATVGSESTENSSLIGVVRDRASPIQSAPVVCRFVSAVTRFSSRSVRSRGIDPHPIQHHTEFASYGDARADMPRFAVFMPQALRLDHL